MFLEFLKDAKIISPAILAGERVVRGVCFSPNFVRDRVVLIYLNTQNPNCKCSGISFNTGLNNHSQKHVYNQALHASNKDGEEKLSITGELVVSQDAQTLQLPRDDCSSLPSSSST